MLRENAAQTALPSVVDRTDLESANSQLWSIGHILSAFAGPPLAGLLIALALPLPFALDATSFGLAALLVSRLALRPRPPRPPRAPFWAELRQGIDWLRGHPMLLRIALMLGVMNALANAADTMMVLYAREVLSLSATGFGLLMSAGAAGGITGALISPRLTRAIGATRGLHLALALLAAGPLMLAVTASAPLAALALFLIALGSMLWNIVTVSFRQRSIPDPLLGRVNAVYRFLGLGMMPIGALVGGALVSALGPFTSRMVALQAPFLLSGLGGLALAAYGWRRLRLPAT